MLPPNKCLFVSTAAILLLFCTSRLSADDPGPLLVQSDLPNFDDVNQLAWQAKQITDIFFEKTLEIRMRYEYANGFLDPNDKAELRDTAAKASAYLEQIANDQNNLKQQIEDYQGDDWETRFGQTGLWRRLAADLQKTFFSKIDIYFYSAITDQAKSDCPPSAVHSGCAAIKASIEKIRCFGPSEPNDLNDLAISLANSDCSNNREMLFSLALLQRKFAPAELQSTLTRSPQTALLLGKFILNDLSTRPNPESITPIDAELAAVTALQTNTTDLYADLITKLAENEKFQTPAVLYFAATVYQRTQPQKTLELLIKASNLQSKTPDLLFKKTAGEMAEYAFNMAYQLFTKDANNCQLAIDAYENYSRIAQDEIDEQTRFFYADLLNHCNRTSQAAEVFSRLANTSQSFWRGAATLELLKIKLGNSAAPAESNEALDQLHDFILRSNRPEEKMIQVRRVAMSLYCEVLISKDNNESAEKVLDILEKAEPTPGLPYDLYRAQATSRLGRLEESARFMSRAVDANDNSIAPQAVSLVSEILDKIELWRQNARDFNEMLQNGARLARFAHESINDSQTALILAEISILQEKRGQESFPENDSNWLRPKARLLMTKGDFNQASLLWAKIVELRRNETAGQNQKSYNWWQAKFYELDCLAKMPQPDRQNIRHTIEVLQSTYADIPAPFAEKLDLLKQQCGASSPVN